MIYFTIWIIGYFLACFIYYFVLPKGIEKDIFECTLFATIWPVFLLFSFVLLPSYLFMKLYKVKNDRA